MLLAERRKNEQKEKALLLADAAARDAWWKEEFIRHNMRKHKRTNESYSLELLLSSALLYISKKATPSPPPSAFFYGHAIMFCALSLSSSPLGRKRLNGKKRKHYKTLRMRCVANISSSSHSFASVSSSRHCLKPQIDRLLCICR